MNADSASLPLAAPLTEAQVSELVGEFYARTRRDPVLGPIFESEVTNWDHHLRIISDFWSGVLLGTGRYRGTPYPVHQRLPLRPEHFERWLGLFRTAATEFLPPAAAACAISKAEMMATSFRAGLFGPGGPLA